MRSFISIILVLVLVAVLSVARNTDAHALCAKLDAAASVQLEWSIDGLGVMDKTPDGIFEFRIGVRANNIGNGGWLAIGFKAVSNAGDNDISNSWATVGWIGNVVNEYQVAPDGTLDRLLNNANLLGGTPFTRSPSANELIMGWQVNEDKPIVINGKTINWRDHNQLILFWYSFDAGVPSNTTNMKWPPANGAQRGVFHLNWHQRYGALTCDDSQKTGSQGCAAPWNCSPCWDSGGWCPNNVPARADSFGAQKQVTCDACNPKPQPSPHKSSTQSPQHSSTTPTSSNQTHTEPSSSSGSTDSDDSDHSNDASVVSSRYFWVGAAVMTLFVLTLSTAFVLRQ